VKQGLRLFGHPVHPMAVHFPMGLLPAAALWQWLGLWRGGEIWWSLGLWTLALGLLAALPAAASGLWDFLALPENSPAETTALIHLGAMIGAVTCFGASLFFQAAPVVSAPTAHMVAFVCSAAGFAVLIIGGRFGAELVYGFGLGLRESVKTSR